MFKKPYFSPEQKRPNDHSDLVTFETNGSGSEGDQDKWSLIIKKDQVHTRLILHITVDSQYFEVVGHFVDQGASIENNNICSVQYQRTG